MERYKELKEMLHAELDRIQDKGELSAASLAQADTIAHTLKDIATVEAPMTMARTWMQVTEEDKTDQAHSYGCA